MMARDDLYDEVHQDTGRKGYLEPDEPLDGERPRLRVRPFWVSESEALMYLHAVEETRGQKPSDRLETILQRFGGGVLKAMPRVRQSRREKDEQLASLRAQQQELGVDE